MDLMDHTRGLRSNENGPSDGAIIGAAQRRLARQKAWIEKIRLLNESGIAPPPDLIPAEAELRIRESDRDLRLRQ
jgi:hypothetical protein